MAITNIYVDPSIAADSGTGTIGDPFGDLEYAIEQTTFDTTNGTQVNIKSGTDEVLVAPINTAMVDTSVSVAWAPTSAAPLVFRGYDAAANDGGIGGISGGGLVAVFDLVNPPGDFISFIDLHCHNTGSEPVIRAGDRIFVCRCEIDTTTSYGVFVTLTSSVVDCYIHTVTGTNQALYLNNSGSPSTHNLIEYDGIVDAVRVSGTVSFLHNIVVVNAATANGVLCNTSSGVLVANNSVYSSANSTGFGISVNVNDSVHVRNNIVEGFSGSGGKGIQILTGTNLFTYGGNAVYDCETPYTVTDDDVRYDYGDNESLSASPFTDPSSNDFSPVDTGGIKEGSTPPSIGNA